MDIKQASNIRVKPSIARIVNEMERGQAVEFDAARDGCLTTARAAVSRANKRLGKKEYVCESNDNGVTYIIKRKKI